MLPSPARCGARNGLVLGGIITVLFFAMLFSRRVPVLSLVTIALALTVPVVLFMQLRRDLSASGYRHTLGALWLDGLLGMLGGSAIAGALLLVFLRWGDPGFLVAEWGASLEILEASGDPSMMQIASDARNATDNGFAITPGMFTASLLWAATFTGSLLSLLAAAVAKTFRRPINK